MAKVHVDAEATARATPAEVWALVVDATGYPRWGPWNDGGYRSQDDEENEVGAVRWLRLGRTTTVEKVVEVDPGRRLAYTVVAGIPVRDYRAQVDLEPVPGGTRIRWAASWDGTILGRMVHRKLRAFYPQMMADLVRAAEESAPSP